MQSLKFGLFNFLHLGLESVLPLILELLPKGEHSNDKSRDDEVREHYFSSKSDKGR